jgi:hypothetical protein
VRSDVQLVRKETASGSQPHRLRSKRVVLRSAVNDNERKLDNSLQATTWILSTLARKGMLLLSSNL